MIFYTHAYARAGLAGNPSDGYFGKTLSVTIKNFAASIALYESPDIEILPNDRDQAHFAGLDQFIDSIQRYGYYGGLRLIKAAIKKFYDYCQENNHPLNNKCFTIRYHSTIPAQVGLAGSSAIITATLRALAQFYQVTIPPEIFPNISLKAETEELGITAGLQDRVVQAYEGLVYMDFNKTNMQRDGHGIYQPLPGVQLPPLYLAYLSELSEFSGTSHGKLRGRFQAGDRAVIDAMTIFADCAEHAKDALVQRDFERFGALMDKNFDARRAIFPISPMNIEMIETARTLGATAKFCGSGGAIIGTYKDEKMFTQLQHAFDPLGVVIVKPEI